MRIEWNKPGERFFETGIDRGVLYPRVGIGTPWNGLVAVSEETSGGEVEPLYFDGFKYFDFVAYEEFKATLAAYSAPREFAAAEGVKALAPGFYVSQQPRDTFGLSYRTLLGNDLVGSEYGYKLHLVYNCTAEPSSRTSATISSNSSPDARSCNLHTVPPPATGFKPTAHVVLKSTEIDPAVMSEIEELLYGQDGVDPALPSIADILSVLGG